MPSDPVLEAISQRLQTFDEQRFGERLFAHDATLWKDDPEHRKIIGNALGWLSVADDMQGRSGDLSGFAAQVAADGYTRRGAARHGRLEPRPRGAAAHVRCGRRLSRPAHLRLDRPGRRAGHRGGPRPRAAPCSSSRASRAGPPRRRRFTPTSTSACGSWSATTRPGVTSSPSPTPTPRCTARRSPRVFAPSF